MKNIFLISFISVLFLSSCDSFLDEPASKASKQEIQTTDDIDLLFSNTNRYLGDAILDIKCFQLTDNCEYGLNRFPLIGGWLDYSEVQGYAWQDEITAAEDPLWTKSFKSIWTSNFVINNVFDLEGEEEDKANLKAEAHLVKAFKYLSLTMKHCLYPNGANANELGLPIKNETEFGQATVRASLSETIDQIEFDITEGLKIEKEKFNNVRESKASAAALAARFYMYIHDFDNAKKYALEALSLHNDMVNMDTDVVVSNIGGYEIPSTSYISSSTPAYFDFWKGQYKVYFTSAQYWYLPSSSLINSYQPEDLRLKYFTTDYFGQWFGLTTNNEVFAKYGSFGAAACGPEVSEMYLIVAECEARDGNYGVCMENVEQVRVNRFKGADYTVLPVPTSIKEAVQLVVDERRRELPFTTSRWADIKRLNAEGLIDPITVTREFYEVGASAVNKDNTVTYTLEPNSRKYARPLPSEIITLTEGKVEQNTY